MGLGLIFSAMAIGGVTVGGAPIAAGGYPSLCCCDTSLAGCSCGNVPLDELPASLDVPIDEAEYRDYMCCCLPTDIQPVPCCDHWITPTSPVNVPSTSNCNYDREIQTEESERCYHDPESWEYQNEAMPWRKIYIAVSLAGDEEGNCWWVLRIESNCGDGWATCGGEPLQPWWEGTKDARYGLTLIGPDGTYTRTSGVSTDPTLVVTAGS